MLTCFAKIFANMRVKCFLFCLQNIGRLFGYVFGGVFRFRKAAFTEPIVPVFSRFVQGDTVFENNDAARIFFRK